jgi:hypothetical protein
MPLLHYVRAVLDVAKPMCQKEWLPKPHRGVLWRNMTGNSFFNPVSIPSLPWTGGFDLEVGGFHAVVVLMQRHGSALAMVKNNIVRQLLYEIYAPLYPRPCTAGAEPSGATAGTHQRTIHPGGIHVLCPKPLRGGVGKQIQA